MQMQVVECIFTQRCAFSMFRSVLLVIFTSRSSDTVPYYLNYLHLHWDKPLQCSTVFWLAGIHALDVITMYYVTKSINRAETDTTGCHKDFWL